MPESVISGLAREAELPTPTSVFPKLLRPKSHSMRPPTRILYQVWKQVVAHFLPREQSGERGGVRG